MPDERRMTVIVVPNDRDNTRTFELTYRRLRRLGVGAGVTAFVLLMMAGSWFWLAGQAARVPGLRTEVRELRRDRVQMQQLSKQLQEISTEYAKVRGMLGADSMALPRVEDAGSAAPAADTASGDSAGEGDPATAASRASLPRRWPLAARGYVTRGQRRTRGGLHPGMDIAVASGSRILASGSGVVSEVGEDSVYGRYVRIAHPGGYESLYAHASELLVRARQRVPAGEVIALSGSTGVSSAPHLHFEIRRNGQPVDPVTMIHNPNTQ
ncbi:M23 family metallopeptidase [Longimicrobium sp.]|jgi:murein DD-endopeptidase MepM/ murein hydrolase activator NlpD|uniref:M23 family metallopeptidase n=1 Tax=Longimicrobium sp. TaxID=2029185 RepID=UPI002EDAA48B